MVLWVSCGYLYFGTKIYLTSIFHIITIDKIFICAVNEPSEFFDIRFTHNLPAEGI